jgi:hypothetical protein
MTAGPVARFCFDHLDEVLSRWQYLWQPAPFIDFAPEWAHRHPLLYDSLLSLDDAHYQYLVSNESACLAWLITLLPALGELTPLRVEPPPEQSPSLPMSAGVPGRKQGQVSAFVAATAPSGSHLLEWCAGQGWLLEGLARRYPTRVLEGIEWQPQLCERGNLRLQQAGTRARLYCGDVLAGGATLTPTHSVLALHACGHLHQALVQQTVIAQPQDIALSPCCFHLGDRRALSQKALRGRLDAASIDRHLAVQDIGVGHGNRQRRAEKGSQWRLGYELMRQHVTGDNRYRPMPSWPGALWQGQFSDFCHHCARHHGVSLNADIDFEHWQRQGEWQHRRVRRLELLRRQFRRLLEWWLVMDIGWYLVEHHYEVEIKPFCAPSLTPRNLLLQARRRDI